MLRPVALLMLTSTASSLPAASVAAEPSLADVPFAPKIVEPAPVQTVRSFDGSAESVAALEGVHATLYSAAAEGYSDGPYYIVNITAPTHYGAGYAYARLLANESQANFNSLFSHEFPKEWQQLLLEGFLDLQYSKFAEPALPSSYKSEMQGIEDGLRSIHMEHTISSFHQGLTLASIAVGDVEKDLFYLLEGELEAVLDGVAADDLPVLRSRVEALRATVKNSGVATRDAARQVAQAASLRLGRTCSFWGAWGSRTDNGGLYSGRNLDWAAQTGVSRYKTITVYHIGDLIPHAAISFAGLTGAITGMSAAGITVHEAGDDNKLVSLEGFSWSLRLRGVMENATNLAEARAFWEATDNTMGINHGIGSAADPGFLALETRAGYTAYFEANDTREADANVNGTHYGFPMPEALWRTNHPYDPKFISTMVGHPRTSGDSQTRYMLLHDTFKLYEDTNVPITVEQAVNITALVGDKGGSDVASFVTCGKAAAGGENIVTATFQPAKQQMYVAFEDGLDNGTMHVPGCCNNYVHLDMAPYFAWSPSQQRQQQQQ